MLENAGRSLLLILASVSMALACSVAPDGRTDGQRRDAATATFHGEMLGSEVEVVCGERTRLLRFKLLDDYSREGMRLPDTVVVASPPSSAVCGVDYPAGTPVLVFAHALQGTCQGPGLLMTTLGSMNRVRPGPGILADLSQPAGLAPSRRRTGSARLPSRSADVLPGGYRANGSKSPDRGAIPQYRP